MNTARPSLIRSIPFWVLIAGSLATSGFGLWLAIDKLGVMTATLAVTGGGSYSLNLQWANNEAQTAVCSFKVNVAGLTRLRDAMLDSVLEQRLQQH